MSATAETFTGSVAAAEGRRLDRPSGAEPKGAAAAREAAVPARASGVELLGEVAGSGYRRPPALARRADGQTIQLTPLLYHLLQAIDGRRGYAELATAVGERTGRLATPDDVRFLAEARLRPLGLLRQPDGSDPPVEKANPLLALRLKVLVSNTDVTRRITTPFAALFHPAIVLAVSIVFALTTWWVAFDKGLASAAHQAFFEPSLLLLVIALTVLSAGFHEIGHAAACRYGGARPGGMGVGLYLVWPAFYTDVTDSYRLDRRARLRVDLGGLYFNAIFGIAILALWAAVRWDALLLVIAAQLLQMVRQLVPIVRFDGYHILADLIGVPDLFHHIKPTLLALLPGRRRPAEGAMLKPWARAVVTLWVLVVVPLLTALLALLVVVLPRLVATAWDSLGQHWDAFEANWAAGNGSAVAVGLLSMLTISLPVLGIAYLLARIVRRTTRGVWNATAGRPPLRAGAALAGVALLSAVVWAWWPNGQYRPIEADQPSTLLDAPRLAASGNGAEPAAFGPAPAEPSAPTDTGAQGRWMLVLLPSSVLDRVGSDPTTTPAEPPAGWVFPFDPPHAPREGDNQALAVTTEDGSSVFDVAVALVWVTDGGPVDNRNEAYALASCNGCRATAVSFQAVMVIGYAQVVTPVNAAVAVNFDCVDCVSQALAVQLVATLTRAPSAEALARLESLWATLEAQSASFELLPLEQVYVELLAAETAILEIVAEDGALEIGGEAVESSGSDDVESPAPEGPGPAPAPETTTTSPDPASPPEEPTTTEEQPTTTEEAPATAEEAPTTTTPP